MVDGRQPDSVIVYDGDCAFCCHQVDRIRRWDRQSRFSYVSSHSEDLLDRFPILSGADMNTGMRLIDSGGRAYVGADAVYQIARRLSGLKYLAWLYRVPGLHLLARATYAWIAANRHRLSKPLCSDGNCARPISPNELAKKP